MNSLRNEVQLNQERKNSFCGRRPGNKPSQKVRTSMNLRFRSVVFSTIMLLGAIICLTGCATTGMDRHTKATNSMQTVEGDYKQASVQIDAIRPMARWAAMDGDNLEGPVKHVLTALDLVKPEMAQGGMNSGCATSCDLK